MSERLTPDDTNAVHKFVLEGFEHQFGVPGIAPPPDAHWQKVRDAGTQLWLDTGDLDEAEKLWRTEFGALTTNNTLLNKEVQKGIYDKLVGEAVAMLRRAAPGLGERELLLEIAFILNARHALRLVGRFDAQVSVELHTDLANDVERTVAYGRRYYAICPQRFIIKVPLTAAGYLGARKLRQAGVPINFTLGFGARQNYLAALLTQPNYVNVFLGRLNAFFADNGLGDGENVGEKATLATQRELLALREAGRSQTALIAASMREGAQVETLAGVDVMTMPTKVAADYRAHPAAQVASQVENDPPVTLSAGVTLQDFNGATLWAVPRPFREAVGALAGRADLDALTPEGLQAHLEKAGCGDLLPRWSDDEIKTAHDDGKIPKLAHWLDKLASRAIGLDALMNLSALESFITDQGALDDRVRSLI